MAELHDPHGAAHVAHDEVAVEEEGLSNTGILAFVIVTALVFFSSAIALTSIFYKYADELIGDKSIGTAHAELAAQRQLEDQRLQSYGYVDKEKQIVHIPIDVAMQKVIEEAKK